VCLCGYAYAYARSVESYWGYACCGLPCRGTTARPRGRPRRGAPGAVQCGAVRWGKYFAIWKGRTEPAGRDDPSSPNSSISEKNASRRFYPGQGPRVISDLRRRRQLRDYTVWSSRRGCDERPRARAGIVATLLFSRQLLFTIHQYRPVAGSSR
jgi:hypothetical protein